MLTFSRPHRVCPAEGGGRAGGGQARNNCSYCVIVSTNLHDLRRQVIHGLPQSVLEEKVIRLDVRCHQGLQIGARQGGKQSTGKQTRERRVTAQRIRSGRRRRGGENRRAGGVGCLTTDALWRNMRLRWLAAAVAVRLEQTARMSPPRASQNGVPAGLEGSTHDERGGLPVPR